MRFSFELRDFTVQLERWTMTQVDCDTFDNSSVLTELDKIVKRGLNLPEGSRNASQAAQRIQLVESKDGNLQIALVPENFLQQRGSCFYSLQK